MAYTETGSLLIDTTVTPLAPSRERCPIVPTWMLKNGSVNTREHQGDTSRPAMGSWQSKLAIKSS